MPGDGAGLPPTLDPTLDPKLGACQPDGVPYGAPFSSVTPGGRVCRGWLAMPARPFEGKGPRYPARAPTRRSGTALLVERKMLPPPKLGWMAAVTRAMAGARMKLAVPNPPPTWKP